MAPTTAPAASPVLDFEVRMSSRRVGPRLDYRVFDMTTGRDVEIGPALSRESGVLCALACIADHSPSRLYVLQIEGQWATRLRGTWAPLPLTPAATPSDALAYCTDMFARGRSVEVCDVAALAASFVGH